MRDGPCPFTCLGRTAFGAIFSCRRRLSRKEGGFGMQMPMREKSDIPPVKTGGDGARISVGIKLGALVLTLVIIFLTVSLISYGYLRKADSQMSVAGRLVIASQDLNSFASLSRSHLTLADVESEDVEAAIAEARGSIDTQRALLNDVRPAMAYSGAGLAALTSLIESTDEMDRLFTEELQPALASGDRAAVDAAIGRLASIHEQQEQDLSSVNDSIQDSITEWERSHKRSLAWAGWVQIGTTLFAALLALGIGFQVYRRLSRRLYCLHHTVDELASGKLESRVSVRGNDEISDVGHSVNQMASALEQSTKDLSKQQSRIRSIHQSITDGIIVFDRQGLIVSANPAAEAALGALEKDLSGTHDTGLAELDELIAQPALVPEENMVKCWKEKSCTHPDCPSFGSSDLRCWLQCGTHCYNEIQGTFKQKRDACERCGVYVQNGLRTLEIDHDGSTYQVIVSPLLNDDGQEDGRVAVLHDISELRSAEKSLRSQNSELLVLNEVAASLTGNIDELDIILGDALKKVVSAVDGRAGIIASASRDAPSIRIRAFTGVSNHMAAFMGLLPASSITEMEKKEGSGLPDARQVLKRWKAIGPLLRREGLVNPIIFPFGSPGETMGVLVVAAEEKTEYSDEEKRLLRAVANQVGVAIQNVDLFNRIEKSKNTWETTFDSMGDGVFVLDKERNVVMANKAMASMLDTTSEKLVGRKCHDVTHKRCEPIDECPFLDVIESGKGSSVEVDEPRLGRSFNVNINPIKDQDGEIVGLVHVMSDITERNRLKEQLLHSEKLAAVGQLVAGVAHELNNPLTGVMGYSQLLLRRFGQSDEEAAHDLQAIIDETERATGIVKNLLSFARKHQPKLSVVDLNEVIRNVLKLRNYEFGVNNIAVDSRLDENLPRTMADAHQLEQVLLNLVNNSVQAISEVERRGRVIISSGFSDGVITVSVEDNGPGISPELQKRVFEPFFTTKEVGKGTGLGLSICYGIIEEHGGELRVESNVEQGAKFSFTLPVTTKAAQDEGRRDNGGSENGNGRRNVLVVDDEHAIVDLLSDILTMDGHGVDVAANCSAALKKLSESAYDSVITDISVTGIEGRELYQRILEIDPELAANVIFITDNAEDSEVRDYLERTGNDYLVKPFDLQDLRHELKKVMGSNGNPG